MEVSNSPDILQHKMNKFLQEFEFMSSYLENLLVLKKVIWTYHIKKIELTLKKLKTGIKFNIENPLFGQIEMNHLGFWVTRKGVIPLEKN